jgi:hypothetical protein
MVLLYNAHQVLQHVALLPMVHNVDKDFIYKHNGQHVLFAQVLPAHVLMQQLSNHV